MIDDNELLSIFIEESQDILASLREQFDQFQSQPKQTQVIEPMLREMHTLKGNARMIGLTEFSEYLHGLEQVWQIIQQEQIDIDQTLQKKLNDLMSEMEVYLQKVCRTRKVPEKVISFEGLNKLLVELNVSSGMVVDKKKIIEQEDLYKKSKQVHKPDQLDTSIRIKSELLDKIAEVANEINLDRSHSDQENKLLSGMLVEIKKQLKIVQDQVIQMQLKADANIKSQMSMMSPDQEFDVLELDYYSNLQKMTRTLNDKITEMDAINVKSLEVVKRNDHILRGLARSTRDLDKLIRHARLISLNTLIPRLEHMVESLGKELGKIIEMRMMQFEGEIDRNVMNQLIAPLEHLIRNAIDHGIEQPEVRKQKGKSEVGLLTLSMMQKGNDIIIEVKDDGQGIDIESIKQKALEKKLWDGHIALTDQEWLQFIFISGFSTKSKVTTISGHGVGLDVVNSAIRRLGGHVVVDSDTDIGTVFLLKIPVTLSVNQALLFYIENQQYAILLSQLEGITRLPYQLIAQRLKDTEDKITIHKVEYSLFSLAEILGVSSDTMRRSKRHMSPIILLRGRNQAIGLVIDELVGCSEVVVKPIAIPFETSQAISGVSMTSSGDIVLVLDAAQLMQKALDVQIDIDLLAPSWKTLQSHAPITTKKILIVDDSNTVREIMSRFLQRNHYKTLLAKDGVEALAVMRQDYPNLMLLDLEMPNMNGFEVLEQMRQDDKLSKIPVIIITSRSSKKHQEKAKKLGVNAFVTKPYRESDLLSLIQKWMRQ